MEEPLFHHLQKVVCVDSKGEFDNDEPIDLIEGRTYTIDNPNYIHPDVVNISVTLMAKNDAVYVQSRFVPVDFNDYAEDTFKECELESLKINN